MSKRLLITLLLTLEPDKPAELPCLVSQDHGLKLTSISGDFVASVKAVENPSDVGIVDLVVVACKSWQVLIRQSFANSCGENPKP